MRLGLFSFNQGELVQVWSFTGDQLLPRTRLERADCSTLVGGRLVFESRQPQNLKGFSYSELDVRDILHTRLGRAFASLFLIFWVL